MKIKKISAIAVLAFSLLLCSCNKAPNNNPKNDDMEFLNTSWGMSPEEVKSALSLKDDDITHEEIGRMDAYIRMRDYNKKILFVHSKTMDNFFIYYNADSIQY